MVGLGFSVSPFTLAVDEPGKLFYVLVTISSTDYLHNAL